MNRPFDPGLQPERTELAWRRTCLALGVGSLIAMRLLPSAFDDALWALGGFAGLMAAALLWFGSRARYQRSQIALNRDGDRAMLPDGALMLALAALTTIIGITGVAIVIAVGNTTFQ